MLIKGRESCGEQTLPHFVQTLPHFVLLYLHILEAIGTRTVFSQQIAGGGRGPTVLSVGGTGCILEAGCSYPWVW